MQYDDQLYHHWRIHSDQIITKLVINGIFTNVVRKRLDLKRLVKNNPQFFAKMINAQRSRNSVTVILNIKFSFLIKNNLQCVGTICIPNFCAFCSKSLNCIFYLYFCCNVLLWLQQKIRAWFVLSKIKFKCITEIVLPICIAIPPCTYCSYIAQSSCSVAAKIHPSINIMRHSLACWKSFKGC